VLLLEPLVDLVIAGRVVPVVLVVIDVGEPAFTVGFAPVVTRAAAGPLSALVNFAEGRALVVTVGFGRDTPVSGRVPVVLVNLSLGRETRTPLSVETDGRLVLERRLLRIAMAYPCPFPPANNADRLVMSLSGESVATSTFFAAGFFIVVSLLMSTFCTGAPF
jgi:hypothetical protein